MRTTYIFIPPMAKISGGMRVLLDVFRHLKVLGLPVELVTRDTRAVFRWGEKGLENILPWNELRLTGEDIWLVPEGWVNALSPGLEAGARCIVYCQNWAFLFSGLPEQVRWGQLQVEFLAVSEPVALFIGMALDQEAPILRPGIDLDLFYPPTEKPSGLRVGYMPRKNRSLSSQIIRVIGERDVIRPEWIPLHGLEHAQVAEELRTCHLYLATGFPEGFSLPPLEAMACGCVPVGFAGFGGWDYMRPVQGGGYRPWWSMREVPWEGNGFWVSDGDVLAAALTLERAASLWTGNRDDLQQVLRSCSRTANAYGHNVQRGAIEALWQGWIEKRPCHQTRP